jgi:hypothetical protein
MQNFEKRQFLDENCQKSKKVVIATSTPGFLPKYTFDKHL